MEKGTVVEFFVDRKITCGVCLEDKGKKLLLLTEGNREISLSQGRIHLISPTRLNPSSSRDHLVTSLKQIAAKRETLKSQVIPQDLWELLQGEEETYDCRTLAEFCFEGEITPDHEAAVFRALYDDRVYFKLKGTTFVPNPPEVVEQILVNIRRAEEREHELAEGSAWIRAVWERAPQEIPLDMEPYIALLKELAIYGTESPRYMKGKELLARAELPPTENTAFQLLVKLGLWDEDENLSLHRSRLNVDFPPEVIHAAVEASQRLHIEDPHLPHCDLTSFSLLSIDSATTQDIDDALSITLEGAEFVVGIHIADASHFVRRDDLLDQEARQRGTSIYLPDQKIPMLPPILSEGVCSLLAGQERLAMSVMARITLEGDIKTSEIFPSRIRVSRRLTYQEVDAQLETDPELSLLFRLSQLLRQKRVEAGALLLPIPQLEISVDAAKNIIVEKIERETPSQIIVSELMILANWLAAHFCQLHHTPALYRSQNVPTGEFIVSEQYDPLLHYRQRRQMSRAEVGVEPHPHKGLGLELYTNFTSPLRRYIDLIIHRQIKAILGCKEGIYSEEELKEILFTLDPVLARANMLEQERKKYWLYRYLERTVGNIYTAIVLECFPNRYHILLPDFLLETDLAPIGGKPVAPGDTITVKIESVNARLGILKVVAC